MLETIIAAQSVKIVSFDVFDTVLTRRTAEPRGVFLLMSRRLKDRFEGLPSGFADDFCRYRIAAEAAARKLKGAAEITLQDIYRELARQHTLDPAAAGRIAELEIAQESAAVIAVPAMRLLLERCRELGKRVLFVSDMYLPSEAVRALLHSLGLMAATDTLYVSSEHGATKSNGALFRLILKRENCLPGEIVHLGDNRRSDYLVPKALGITTYRCTEALLTQNEKILLGERELAGQLLAGASRSARLRGDRPTRDEHRALYALGASLAGPLFAAYLAWMLPHVKQAGVRRLYFVARDGQILHEMARLLFLDQGIELRYLYGSRQAWHLPALTRIGPPELSWITKADPHLSVRVLAGRVLLDPVVVQESLKEAGLAKDLDSVFTGEETRRLGALLMAPGGLAARIEERAAALRPDAVGYLRQEGLFDDVPWALVDLGWFGNLQDSLQKLLYQAGREVAVRGYYFGLLQEPRPGTLKHPFMFSPGSDARTLDLGACFVPLAELFACADHGSTVQYRNSGGSFVPVLKDRPEWIDAWGIGHLRSGALNFLAGLDPAAWRQGIDLRERMLTLMGKIFFAPEQAEAAALGEYRFSSDQGETLLRPFAPALTLWDSLRYIRLFQDFARLNITFWLNGSRVRSAWHVKLFLTVCSRTLVCLNTAKRHLRSSPPAAARRERGEGGLK